MSTIPLSPEASLTPEDRERFHTLPLLNIYRLITNAPGTLTPWTNMVGTIYTAFSLNGRLREIGILRHVSAAQAPYPVHQHRLIASNTGITDKEIEIITTTKTVNQLSDIENLICKAADQLHITATWSDQLRTELIKHLGVRETTELLIILSLYSAVARIANGANLPIESTNPLQNARAFSKSAVLVDEVEVGDGSDIVPR